jgi:hypothetical protein
MLHRVKEDLENNNDKYRAKIATYQDLIRKITDLSNAVETEERRNRDLARAYFRSSKDQINQNRKSNQAALDYYLTMNKSKITPPQFYDSKN